MSDELRLPDELAACEARLAGQPLPAARIDRDQLLYRAGWAAAEAELTGRTSTFASTKPTRRLIAAWSLTSAALAASLAVAATHTVISGTQRQTVELPANQAPITSVAEKPTREVNDSAPRHAIASSRGPDLEGIVAAASRANRRPPAAALLAVYELPHGNRWSDPIIVSNAGGGAAPVRLSPVTARGLLDELLPTDRRAKDADAGVDKPSQPEAPTTFRPLARGEEVI